MNSLRTPHKTKLAVTGDLGKLIPESMKLLLEANGLETVRQLGIESIRVVILDVLVGKNLRSVTEGLTRRRIAALNLATMSLFLKGDVELQGFIQQLPEMAAKAYSDKSYGNAEHSLAQWILGLTNKAYQNVLRSDKTLIPEYKDVYVEACREVIANHEKEYGPLTGTLSWVANSTEKQEAKSTHIDWQFMLALFNTVGAQTLTIRGSDKSTYGKLFERLVLGTLLSILGFSLVPSPEISSLSINEKVFWLSSTTGDDREIDATVIVKPGQGIRFDIGFIGVGNTEITNDKTTRFRRNAEIAGKSHLMATIIIVDRVGEKSSVPELARQLKNGHVVQMSAAFWPQQVAGILKSIFPDFNDPLIAMDPNEIEIYLKKKLENVPIEAFLPIPKQIKRNKSKPSPRVIRTINSDTIK